MLNERRRGRALGNGTLGGTYLPVGGQQLQVNCLFFRQVIGRKRVRVQRGIATLIWVIRQTRHIRLNVILEKQSRRRNEGH